MGYLKEVKNQEKVKLEMLCLAKETETEIEVNENFQIFEYWENGGLEFFVTMDKNGWLLVWDDTHFFTPGSCNKLQDLLKREN